ncbi:hypothetical protein WA026_020800 [Henosepilachna vigintioctopunctata]|uniref:Uncharacterized protein n=1 Tax=Henosepilachna vigintioctopunctata TaxID=420089 RepID=A0AAW1TXJ1_9CUCU
MFYTISVLAIVIIKYKMAASEDEVELRLDKCGKKIEFKCAHCGKKVVDKVQCGKCLENFHPSCLGQAACRKDAICKHLQLEKMPVEQATPYEELMIQYKIMNIENEYLKKLLEECQGNNRLLRENNKLLNDKVSFLEQKSDKKLYNQAVQKNINTVPIQIGHTDNMSSELQPSKAIPTKPSQNQGNVNVKDINNLKKLPTVVENKQTNILELDKNKEETNSMEGPWRKVVSRRIRTIGTAQTTANNEINTAFQGRNNGNKKVWLFLSRIKTGVTEEIIKTYLNEKLELSAQETPIVKKINTFHKMEDNECFQIGWILNMENRFMNARFGLQELPLQGLNSTMITIR